MAWATTGVTLKGPKGDTGDTGPSGAPGPRFVGVATANTTATSGIWTPIAFASESIDSHNGHSTVTATSRFIIPAGWGGIYRVTGAIAPTGGTGGTVRAVAVAKNGSQYGPSQANYPSTVNDSSIITVPTMVPADAGDYLELQFYHNAGSNRAVIAALTSFTVEFAV